MAAAPTVAPSQRWLYGPMTDLLLGCGVAYVGVFVLLTVAGPRMREVVPYGLAPLVLLVTGTPHYGATLLRVYERREDRRAYWFFSVWLTVAVWIAFVAGVHWTLVGSWMLTIMLTWSPWHYAGQNYGIALMFLGRRGVKIAPHTKRLFYASFFLSFLLTFFATHGAAPTASYAPTAYGEGAVEFIPLGIPQAFQRGALLGTGLLYVAVLGAAVWQLRRTASWRDVAPTLAIVASQALWFSVPVLTRWADVLQGIEPFSTQQATYAFLWVAVAHSVQYLWICSYYAKRQGASNGEARYLLKVLLAGAAIFAVPAFVFAPETLGRVPYNGGLALVLSAAVNLHHFVLDGAIWKLRDGRIARLLIRRSEGDPELPRAVGERRSLAPLVWAVGVVSVVVIATSALEHEYGVLRALKRGDSARVERALGRLRVMGRDDPSAWSNLALLHMAEGELTKALGEAERAVGLNPTAAAWEALGQIRMQAGQEAEAIAAFQEALRRDPGSLHAANNLAWVHATHPEFRFRDPRRAVELARTAVAASGGRDARVLDTLAAAYAAAGYFDAARRSAERGRALAIESGDPALAAEIERRSQLYAAGRPFRAAAGVESPSASAGAN